VRRKFGGGKKQMRVELDTSPLIPLPGRGGEEKESAFIGVHPQLKVFVWSVYFVVSVFAALRRDKKILCGFCDLLWLNFGSRVRSPPQIFCVLAALPLGVETKALPWVMDSFSRACRAANARHLRREIRELTLRE
jgi:hypothetical protein